MILITLQPSLKKKNNQCDTLDSPEDDPLRGLLTIKLLVKQRCTPDAILRSKLLEKTCFPKN
jgi:hypothetical protein